jgi:hypothetical protein
VSFGGRDGLVCLSHVRQVLPQRGNGACSHQRAASARKGSMEAILAPPNGPVVVHGQGELRWVSVQQLYSGDHPSLRYAVNCARQQLKARRACGVRCAAVHRAAALPSLEQKLPKQEHDADCDRERGQRQKKRTCRMRRDATLLAGLGFVLAFAGLAQIRLHASSR